MVVDDASLVIFVFKNQKVTWNRIRPLFVIYNGG